MQILSPEILLAIIPLLILYYLLPRWKRIFLFAMSLALPLTISSGVFFTAVSVAFLGYIFSLIVSQKKSRLLLSLFAVIILSPLMFIKYFTSADLAFQKIFSLLHLPYSLSGAVFLMPLGISFYSFRALGILFETYKKDSSWSYGFLDYFVYVLYFPCFLAGPIEKPENFFMQLKKRVIFKPVMVTEGLRQILAGVFIKMVLADRLSLPVGTIFSRIQASDWISIITGMILFSIQLYLDFSAYSRIAFGVSKIFGINVTWNFNNPYFASGISDFWKRWHISLTNWFREYVYIPLGGGRKNSLVTARNILITFILSGAWHGNGLNFLLWGALHGLWLSSEKIIFKLNIKLPKTLSVPLTFLTISYLWLLFKLTVPDFIAATKVLFLGFSGFRFPMAFESAKIITEPFTAYALLLTFAYFFYEAFGSSAIMKKISGTRFVRWAFYYSMIFLIVFLGINEKISFIYARF